MSALNYSIVELNEEVLIQYSPNIVIYIHTHKFLCYEAAERSQAQTSALLLLA